jgi:peptidyl-prolyl cis-trans isomerase D
MLQKIHERVQGVIAWILIILIAITFMLFGLNYYLESHASSDVQAEVNGTKISKLDFSHSYQRLKRQAEEQANDLTLQQEKALKKRALKQLIFTQVVLQGADSSGYLINRQQAEQALLQIPQFQENGQFSAERFQQTLSAALYTPAVFMTKIQEGLLINQQRFAFAGTVFLLPQEINQLMSLAKQTRNVDYLIIPKKVFVPNVKVSESELKHYYEKNKVQFKVPEQIKIDYIAVSMKKVLSETTISSNALKHYYQDNLDAYTQPAKWRWAQILVRVPADATKTITDKAQKKALVIEKMLQKSLSFSKVAKENSEDVLSASKGGLMPWSPELSIKTEILSVLKNLKDKEISAPIKTQYGYEIIQRVGYQAEKQVPFDTVKQQIMDILKMEKAQETFSELGDDLTNLSYQNPSSLIETSKTLGLPIETSELFTRKGLSSGIVANKAIVQSAFSDEVLRDGNNSALIAVGDDLMVVLRVNEHKPLSFKPFDAVQETVRRQMIQEKASIFARQYGKKLLKAFKKNPDHSKILEDVKKYGLVWITQKNVPRDDVTLKPEILSALFNMPPVASHEVHFSGVSLDDGDYAVLKLTHVKPGSVESLDQEEQKMVEDEVEAAFGIIDYNLYVEGLMHKAKIIENK